MNTARAKMVSVLLALGLLVAGAFVGAMVDRRFIRGPEVSKVRPNTRSSERLLDRFKRRLGLNDKQVAAIAEIMKNTRAESRALRKKRREDIAALLTPDQREEYKRMVKRMNKRRKNRRDRRRRPRSP